MRPFKRLACVIVCPALAVTAICAGAPPAAAAASTACPGGDICAFTGPDGTGTRYILATPASGEQPTACDQAPAGASIDSVVNNSNDIGVSSDGVCNSTDQGNDYLILPNSTTTFASPEDMKYTPILLL